MNNTILSREQSAAIKGLLICLVVLGHNVFFEDALKLGTWIWLYSFHVAGFFILPFFYQEHQFSLERVKTYAKRLLWPYLYMFVLLTTINYIVFKNLIDGLDLLDVFFTGNFYRINVYTGFQYLWFLPTMFSMLVIKDVYTSGNLIVKRAFLFIGVLFYVFFWIFLYHGPYDKVANIILSRYSFLSFMIGFAMFFLGCLTRLIFDRQHISGIVLFVLLVLSLVGLITAPNLTFGNVVYWLSRAICPIIFFLFLTKIYFESSILNVIGAISLPVYLIHQPINYMVYSLLKDVPINKMILFVISYVIVMTTSFFIAKWITTNRTINKVLFPR